MLIHNRWVKWIQQMIPAVKDCSQANGKGERSVGKRGGRSSHVRTYFPLHPCYPRSLSSLPSTTLLSLWYHTEIVSSVYRSPIAEVQQKFGSPCRINQLEIIIKQEWKSIEQRKVREKKVRRRGRGGGEGRERGWDTEYGWQNCVESMHFLFRSCWEPSGICETCEWFVLFDTALLLLSSLLFFFLCF